MFDFDKVVDRRGTLCTQWDFVKDRFGHDDLLPFTISDMDFATAPAVLSAMQDRIDHGVFGYSRWQHEDFYQSIEHWYLSRYDTHISREMLVTCPSVIYGVAKLICQWSDTGDGVVIHTPAYDGFYKILKGNRRTALDCPLIKDSSGKWQCDFDLLETLLMKPSTKILLLCSPHNPTGKVWTQEELMRMNALCERYDVKVISDEIHMDLCWQAKHIPWQKIATTDYAVVTSASKSFNFPALTGAYAFINNPEDREQFLYQLKNVDSISSPAIFFVLGHIAAYTNGGIWLDALRDYLQANLIYLSKRLNESFPELNWAIPESTYLAWIDLSSLNIDDDKLQYRLIHELKVAIMPGTTYGEIGKGFIRLNVACPRSKLKQGIDALISAINLI
ncbi:MalY/PatB family protein [Thorsellia anophelis]|uniref:cysteine-S-conjugate beta-lyase n=1 Tax=Thorsellia anophelis DSM 18579 TaxID=1123402 RepID=A0A1I0ERB5_9GAMM|nr:MalY/PatB family protein [Thorsellia anophelis]SET47871.1 cystathione beta-lyase [Thorsellia anophelis DSM 18579]